jgi:hypothetical protein
MLASVDRLMDYLDFFFFDADDCCPSFSLVTDDPSPSELFPFVCFVDAFYLSDEAWASLELLFSKFYLLGDPPLPAYFEVFALFFSIGLVKFYMLLRNHRIL